MAYKYVRSGKGSFKAYESVQGVGSKVDEVFSMRTFECHAHLWDGCVAVSASILQQSPFECTFLP